LIFVEEIGYYFPLCYFIVLQIYSLDFTQILEIVIIIPNLNINLRIHICFCVILYVSDLLSSTNTGRIEYRLLP